MWHSLSSINILTKPCLLASAPCHYLNTRHGRHTTSHTTVLSGPGLRLRSTSIAPLDRLSRAVVFLTAAPAPAQEKPYRGFMH